MTDATLACQWCGKPAHRSDAYHGTRCPEVRAFEYRADGSLSRVEFVTPGDRQPACVEHIHPTAPRELTEPEKERIARDHMRRIRM